MLFCTNQKDCKISAVYYFFNDAIVINKTNKPPGYRLTDSTCTIVLHENKTRVETSVSPKNITDLQRKLKEEKKLATLLKGAGLAFDMLKVLKISKINNGCFKAVKLVKKL